MVFRAQPTILGDQVAVASWSLTVGLLGLLLRFDEIIAPLYDPRMPVSNRDVRLLQAAYPQIYFACHARHVRRASTGTPLSAADPALLAHLDETSSTRPTELAKHLSIAASTLSAAINRLAALEGARLTQGNRQ